MTPSLSTTPLQVTNQINSKKTNQYAAMDRVAKEYESVFITEMLGHMFKGIGPNNLFGGGHAEEVYRSLLLQEYGKSIAKSGGLGISNALKEEMIRLQEGQ